VPRIVLAVFACLLIGANVAYAHDLQPEVDHRDPRIALPESLVTQPVAQAEMSAEPTTALSTTPLPETWCGTPSTGDGATNATVPASAAQLKLVYAYASNQTSRFASFDDKLQANVSLLGRYLAAQSGNRKALRWDMGTDCGTQYVDIQVVQLPDTLEQYNDNVNTRFD